jgi:hypothetical protein
VVVVLLGGDEVIGSQPSRPCPGSFDWIRTFLRITFLYFESGKSFDSFQLHASYDDFHDVDWIADEVN